MSIKWKKYTYRIVCRCKTIAASATLFADLLIAMLERGGA